MQAITDFTMFTDSSQLRRGVINYYHRCVPDATEPQAPLIELLKGCTNKKSKISWTIESDTAPERCKQDIAPASTSVFLSSTRRIALYIDASNMAISATLDLQRADGTWFH